MDTQSMRLKTVAPPAALPSKVGSSTRKAFAQIIPAIVRILRLRRSGATPYVQDADRWVYLSRIQRPRL